MVKNQKEQKNAGFVEPRINNELRFYNTVRLIYKEKNGEDSENDFNKVVSMKEAFDYSKKYRLDLIEINGKTNPPIVKLYDYGKYLFELKKALKAKNKNKTDLKEIQLKVNISQHDLETKVKKAKEFITNGDKVKVVLTMKGRELTRREQSKVCFLKFVDMMMDCASFDNPPRDEGNRTITILKKK